MRGSEIDEVLKKVPTVHRYLRAICAIDSLPEKLNPREFLVVNTE